MVVLLAAMTTEPGLNMTLGKDTVSINNLGINASAGACCVDNISTTRLWRISFTRPESVCTHCTSFFWRRNPTKTIGFLLPWISPWFFIGFLLSPPPYAQSFLRKPSFLVLADFFPWFFYILATAWFSWSCYRLKQGPNRNITFYLSIIKVEYSKEYIQTC